jgi:glucose-6-phosphate 1-dehydrogenase
MDENFGVEGRGRFYDETGAIRDVVQNHPLQVVSMLAMEPPSTVYRESVRDEHVKVLRSIRPLDPDHLNVDANLPAWHAGGYVNSSTNPANCRKLRTSNIPSQCGA